MSEITKDQVIEAAKVMMETFATTMQIMPEFKSIAIEAHLSAQHAMMEMLAKLGIGKEDRFAFAQATMPDLSGDLSLESV